MTHEFATAANSESIGGPSEQLGRAFAEAVSRKDFGRVESLLDPEIDFQALTPRRTWQASAHAEVVGEILPTWFDDSDHIDQLAAVDTGAVGDRAHVAYRFHGHTDDGPFVVEQQAYYTTRDGRIDWMRIVCSGFRPREA
jgi:hypothetical protein